MLEDVKTLLGEDQNEKLEVIHKATEARLKVLLGGLSYVPPELEYIVTEVTVSRFNRIGSEGLASHTVEGETMSWNTDADFAPFTADMEAFLDEANETKRGRVRFL